MTEATQEGEHLLNRGGGRNLRFRDLLHQLFSMAGQGRLRPEFLQAACGSVREFLACDVLELRLEEAGKVRRCRSSVGADSGDPSMAGPIMESVLRGHVLAASPFSTRGGSFWTGDATRPVLLREAGQQDAPPRSLVIGGDHPSLAFVPVPVAPRSRGILLLGSRKADFFTRDDIQFFEAVGETLGVAIAFQAAQWALRERVKELDCLYGIAKLSQRPGLALDQQLQEIVALLPPAWQYPGLAAARIILDRREFCSDGFRETPWLQAAELHVGEALRGAVQVAYSQEMPDFDEGPFLSEERNLIEEVAHQLGLLVGRRDDEKAKAKLFHMLEQRRE